MINTNTPPPPARTSVLLPVVDGAVHCGVAGEEHQQPVRHRARHVHQRVAQLVLGGGGWEVGRWGEGRWVHKGSDTMGVCV